MRKQVPLRCVKCDELIPLEDEVVIDPETGEPTMGGDAYHPRCAPSTVTPKMLTITRSCLEDLGLDWEVREDARDPAHPGIIIQPGLFLFVTIGEDGRWALMSESAEPTRPKIIKAGEEDHWWEAIVWATTRLFRYHFGRAVDAVIYDNEDLRPEGF